MLNTGVPILIFILILGIVVFVHELGHFLMARRAGIFVEEFAMGMGPKLVTIRGKKKAKTQLEGTEDVTLYTIRMLPLGGFCKMRGMEENIPNDDEAMNNKSLFDRILVIAGGSAMNFLLAIILFTILVYLVGYTTLEVRNLQEGRPAQVAGLEVGDRVTHINNSRLRLWEDLRFMMDISAGREIELQFTRDGERHTIAVNPVLDPDGVYRIGLEPVQRVGSLFEITEETAHLERVTVGGSIVNAIHTMGFNVRVPFRILSRVITRQPVPDGAEMQSVIGMGAVVTEIYQETIEYGVLPMVLTMINIAAVISVAIGIMNLMPIPALDGARLIFLALEGIRRKPVSAEREGMVHMVGFIILLALIVVIMARDVIRLL